MQSMSMYKDNIPDEMQNFQTKGQGNFVVLQLMASSSIPISLSKETDVRA